MKPVKKLNTKIKKEFRLWAEGKYIDFWTVNHTLAGIVIAGTVIFLNLPLWLSLIILFVLTISWEIYETVKNIHESEANRIIDVIVAIIGFIVMYILMMLDIFNNLALFSITTVLFVILNISGWLSYKKRIR